LANYRCVDTEVSDETNSCEEVTNHKHLRPEQSDMFSQQVINVGLQLTIF